MDRVTLRAASRMVVKQFVGDGHIASLNQLPDARTI